MATDGAGGPIADHLFPDHLFPGHLFLGALALLLLPVVVVDIRERRIPNSVNLAIAALGVLRIAARDRSLMAGAEAAGQAALAFAAFVALAWIVRSVRRNATFGMGDIKFLAAAAAWAGVEGSVGVLMLASCAATLAAVAASPWLGFDLRRQMPFGPPLALGLAVVVGLDGG